MTILFGLVARLPFAFAAGLGINSFLAVSVVGQVTWPEAMGLVLINGLIIVLLAATGLRRLIFDAVPIQLKIAITVGIGLFIAFIGLRRRGLRHLDRAELAAGRPRRRTAPSPRCRRSSSSSPSCSRASSWRARCAAPSSSASSAAPCSRVIVEAIWHLGSEVDDPGGWGLSVPALPEQWVSLPDLALVGQVSFGSFERIGVLAALMLVFTLVFTNFFDAMGTLTGLSKEARPRGREGELPAPALGADRRGRRRGRRRLHVELLEHRLHRVGLRHRRGRAHGTREPRDRSPLPRSRCSSRR